MTNDRNAGRDHPTRRIDCDVVELGEEFGVWTLWMGRIGESGDIAEYVALQSPGEDDDNWGPYIEVDDQRYGGYNLVRRIVVADSYLELEFTKGLGPDRAERLVLTFPESSDNGAMVARGLELVFGEQLDALRNATA